MSPALKGPPLPGKQQPVLRLPRYSLIILAAGVLVFMVAWVAIRSAGPVKDSSPKLVVPTTAASVVPAAVIETPPSSPAPSRVKLAASPASATRTSSSPAPRRSSPTPSASPSPSPSATPSVVLSATYKTGASWREGFIGWLTVRNKGEKPATWTVTVTFPSRADVRLGPVWNARATTSGDTVTFTGGPLAPGASVDAGFSAGKSTRGKVAPVSCSIAGRSCQ
ncbi:cellulose binding domain-containing protein [Symbioplanes lichenis]|uniref:cellulose binding domain-containing protein n=1 Tax=Symbioplanes lichenis TaxID=1629072 RepID=UPI002739C2AC|nr:cellulose binding domain-containing protein [Actinoplanes lichenis]